MTPNRIDRGRASTRDLLIVAALLIAIVLGAALVVDRSPIGFAAPEEPLRALIP